MSTYIDRTFLLRISAKLDRFSQKKDDLYQFRCPMCGDSAKDKTKARGFVYKKDNDYFYMCHNCGISTNFYNLLKQVDPTLLKEYSLERYKDKGMFIEKVTPIKIVKHTNKKEIPLPKIHRLPNAHFAKTYVVSRKIPKGEWSELYYCEDFNKFVNVDMGIEKKLYDNDPRLVIPFYDAQDNLVGFQGRSLNNSKLRYITIKLDETSPKVFGLNRINEEEPILVVEGPIDSMFLKNCIAIASSNLQVASELYDKSKLVLVFDNEPRNKEILKLMESAIDDHFAICIWPEMVVEKDINEMILSGFDAEDIQDIIEKNTFVNLRAKMAWINWKKIEI